MALNTSSSVSAVAPVSSVSPAGILGAPQLPKLSGPAHPHDHSGFSARKIDPGFTSGLGISMTSSELSFRSQQAFKPAANSAPAPAQAGPTASSNVRSSTSEVFFLLFLTSFLTFASSGQTRQAALLERHLSHTP